MDHADRIVPEDVDVFSAAEQATASNKFLICDGHQTQIASRVPPGWFRLGVSLKPTKEQDRCAA